MKITFALLVVFGVMLDAAVARADDPAPATPPASAPAADQEALFKHFEDALSGVKLVGRFTVLGKEDEAPRQEEYTINRVTKLPDGDLWLFNARIKYGQKDLTLPLPLDVKWAGDTPVITLTDLTIPGMGTFSARVVIYNKKYAGTWTHGKVGGHLFGIIEKDATEAPSTPAP